MNDIISKKYFLSDINPKLMDLYGSLRSDSKKILSRLNKMENSEEYYYKERSKIYRSKISQASQFIYLNKTCFNGLYRENKNGVFNVPYGNKIYDFKDFENNISNWQVILKKNRIIFQTMDFFDIIKNVKKNDLVYLDPPYTVAHENNGFIKYNQNLFLWEDQIRLKKLVDLIINKEAYFILSNAYHDSILNLYKGIGSHYVLDRNSVIGVGKSRKKIKEVLITNIETNLLGINNYEN